MVCMLYCLTDGSLDWFFFFSSTAYPTVRVPYCSMAGTTAGSWGQPSPLPVDDFANVPRTVDCSRYRLFFRSLTAFTTVCAPYCAANVSAYRPIFRWSIAFTTDGTRYCSADGSGWQRIAHSCTRQRLSRQFSCCVSQRMATDSSYFRLSMALKTDCAPYCATDGSGLLIPPLANGFRDGFRAILLNGSLIGSCNFPLVVLHGEWDYRLFVGSLISYAFR